MNPIYSTTQLKEFLSTLSIGSEATDAIVAFAEIQDARVDWQGKRINVAANMLGHDLINEMMCDD